MLKKTQRKIAIEISKMFATTLYIRDITELLNMSTRCHGLMVARRLWYDRFHN